jgi:hypothetical protein
LSAVVLRADQTAGGWRLAVSTSGDPAGTYNLYAIDTTGGFPDFPKLGVCDDKVVLTRTYNVNTFHRILVANKRQLVLRFRRNNFHHLLPRLPLAAQLSVD